MDVLLRLLRQLTPAVLASSRCHAGRDLPTASAPEQDPQTDPAPQRAQQVSPPLRTAPQADYSVGSSRPLDGVMMNRGGDTCKPKGALVHESESSETVLTRIGNVIVEQAPPRLDEWRSLPNQVLGHRPRAASVAVVSSVQTITMPQPQACREPSNDQVS